MRKLYCLFFLFIGISVNAQNNVGIGILSPDQSAVLHLQSNNKGLLIPRLTAAERTAISAPANGLLVYDTDATCFFFFRNNAWESLCAANTSAVGITGYTGPTGAQGLNGIIGATGIQGSQGIVGATGADGNDGVIGITGATGNNGTNGEIGITGATGNNGTNGDIGVTGATGNNGSNGVIGFTGATGNNGTNGEIGITGATGSNGTNGEIGVTGATGNNGTNGTNGEIGVTGTTGNNGSNGEIGVTGATGNNGTNGVIGVTGATGNNGTNGEIGVTGATGNNGTNGEIGITGATGQNGTNGEIGVTGATGNNGTNGDIGITGATGNNGTNGIIGTTGATGNNGTNGIIGVTGATGQNGTNGEIGVTGATGNNGTNGEIGVTGATGNNGTNGEIGVTGTTGNNGTNGEIGVTGATGQNGTNGEIGVTGATGNNGTNGEIGVTGATGNNGTNGEIGVTGATGNNGTNGEIGVTGATGNTGNVGSTGHTGTTGDIGVTGSTGQVGATGPVGCATANYILKSTGTSATCTTAPIYDNGNNVGIGITTGTPLYKLQIAGGAGEFGFQPGDASPNSGYVRFGDNTGWKFHIGRGRESSGGAVNTTTTGVLVTVQDNGNVGIGSTSPNAKLDVAGDVLLNSQNSIQKRRIITQTRTIGGTAGDYIYLGTITSNGKGTYITVNESHHFCGSINTAVYEFSDNYYAGTTTDWMQVPTQNYRSHTGSQDFALDVRRTATHPTNLEIRFRNLGGACGGGDCDFEIQTNGTYTASSTTGASGTVAGFLSSNAYQFPISNDRFQAATDGLFMINSGNVGIGTVSPTQKLDINGQVRIRGGSPAEGSILTSSDVNGNAVWTSPPSLNTSYDGGVSTAAGTANILNSTTTPTLLQGTYFVVPYNCLSAPSANYYIIFDAVAVSGTISGGYAVYDYSQLNSFTINPFVIKVQSATATVNFRVRHGNGGTVTNTSGSCNGFSYWRIGN